jgi:hypothetical protein
MKLTASIALFVYSFASLTLMSGCDGGSGTDSEATPAVIRTATSRAAEIVVDEGDLGEGWDELEDDEATAVPGPDGILDGSFRSWARCVGNLLSGGFIGLGRAAVELSPRFGDDSGRVVAGAAAVFVDPARRDEVVASVATSREMCDVANQALTTALTELTDPAGAAASYRMTVTLTANQRTFQETFDLMVFRGDLTISLLVFKGFGANGADQTEIAGRVEAKLR